MSKNSKYRPYYKRLAIVFAICLVFVIAFNEISYSFFKEGGERAPKSVQIVIPEGTATRIAAGEQTPSIPSGMTFVAGDVLEVVNLDKVDHQLGPLWIPAGTTASLALDNAEKLSYACSFQATKYLNIDVRAATTLYDRLTALTLAVPTMTALVFLYSLAALPIDQDNKKKNKQPAPIING
jgi:hypothetical protein